MDNNSKNLVAPENIGAYLEQRQHEVIARLRKTMPRLEEGALNEAFDFARRAHAGQLRKSGEPYLVHPVEVALIVAQMNLDADSVIAALLHDTIEDTGYNYNDIKSRFGNAVAEIVDGVTKLTRTTFASKEDQQMENLRKMFLAMAQDIRVILIKIADRLHNMRTSEYWSEHKRREKSFETMEIYAPLAHRLGMQRIKWEMEDLSLKNLDPVGYQEILRELDCQEQERKDFLSGIQSRIKNRLEEAGIPSAIKGRIKHIYSIYRKKYDQHKAMFEIYDLYAVRVIVDDMTDCYNVLGFVHDLYKPIPGRFKDYISTPKPNMYQSLHTTVIGNDGKPFEVQIRTWDMHRTAEYGIAAHWMYKDGVEGEKQMSEKLAWVRGLLESQQDSDAEEFIRAIKVDMFADEVFVFTPRGKVINLPNGAGIIDFAYAIHSEVGNRMLGARVGGRMVNLEYKLQNGDIVEIVTGSTHGPSRDWLKMVKTSEARNKIRQWFKKEKREENVAQGRMDFERELRRSGIAMATVTQDDVLLPALKKMSFGSVDDMYAAIGYGGLSVIRTINRIRDELIRKERQNAAKTTEIPPETEKRERKPRTSVSGVIVEGLENCMVKFSRCCSPVPGDDITGFITKGYGISIHRTDCPNVKQMRVAEEQGRWVSVAWAERIPDQKYVTHMHIHAYDRPSLLLDIMSAVQETHFPLLTITAKTQQNGAAEVSMSAEVLSREQSDILRGKLTRIDGVIAVERR